MNKNLYTPRIEYSNIRRSTIIELDKIIVECIIYKNYVYNVLQKYYKYYFPS